MIKRAPAVTPLFLWDVRRRDPVLDPGTRWSWALTHRRPHKPGVFDRCLARPEPGFTPIQWGPALRPWMVTEEVTPSECAYGAVLS